MKPLKEGEIQAILSKHPDDAGVKALDDEITRIADEASDFGILLDQIARDSDCPYCLSAAALLRKWEVPGWKE